MPGHQNLQGVGVIANSKRSDVKQFAEGQSFLSRAIVAHAVTFKMPIRSFAKAQECGNKSSDLPAKMLKKKANQARALVKMRDKR
jgi:hypothetical protein